MATDAFDKVMYNGRLMDKKTRAFVQKCEADLGYNMTITQGSYNAGGVSASAGTHDKGGVLDIPSNDRERKLKVIKDNGGWGWYRPAIPGLWGPHIHFGITDHGNLAPLAAQQQVLYFAGRDGLKGNRADGSYRAKGRPVFKYPVVVVPPAPKPTNVSRARDEAVTAIHESKQARALLANAPKDRTLVWRRIAELDELIATYEAWLKELPKR